MEATVVENTVINPEDGDIEDLGSDNTIDPDDEDSFTTVTNKKAEKKR